ncbi:HNH endonuclease signature motif containing protein [Paractinoplanes durhamensis]|uniref:HNH nuclease domain-containing protein n=1 Tax=Paractinoplanes durhamensis TaxID=113563 RepID=A0ABQ3Z3Q0_9ACTN|nr:HNH endonuclease signature motif containing protein [Actinoplanes durhamensis]GIE04449.1 hypothetical protein Adu01nite_57990 [Actinoplanes durhamensis]
MLEDLTEIRDLLAKCDGPLWSRADSEVLAGLETAWACAQQTLAITARLIHEAESRGIPQQEAQSSTPVWLRQRLRTSIWEAKQLTALAAALARFPALDAAITAGTLSADQVRTIATALTALPTDTGPAKTTEAESALIAFAADFDPTNLARLGARILAYIDPEAADRHDAELLKRQEENARRSRGFTMSPFGDGRVRLSGWLDTTAAATVNAALDPLCHPGQDAQIDADLTRTPAQRRADALVDICNRVLRQGDLPTSGGDPAQLVVTIPLDTLRTTPATAFTPTKAPTPPTAASAANPPSATGAPSPTSAPSPASAAAAATPSSVPSPPSAADPPSAGAPPSATTATRARSAARPPSPTAATSAANPPSAASAAASVGGGGCGRLDTGAPVGATEARLLACDARVVPAVLGTDGQVLDVGQARRLFTGPLRRALVLRDRGCSFPGCDRPAAWCEGHHLIPWADGGPTALSNACLLCRHHHRVIHHTDWKARLATDGHPEFIPPATVDAQRRPRRNIFHRRE